MTVKQKLILLYIISFIFLLSLVIVNYYFNYKRESIYITEQNIKLKNSSISAIELNNEFYKNITFDYTYWDDMQNFNAKPDTVWAASILGSMPDAYGIDYVWAYNLSGEMQYSTYNEEYPIIENPLEIKNFYNIFDTINNGINRFTLYYLQKDTNIVAVFGATVHSTADIDRIEKPTGFFFVAKVIDGKYLEKLSTITNCTSAIVWDTTKIEEKNISNLISCYNQLNTWDNEYICSINFKREDSFIKQDKSFKKLSMLILIIIIFVIICFAIIFTNIVVSRPLKKIKSSLDSNNPDILKKLAEKKNNEFGQIAKLILLFFNQKQNLETEIEERKSIEEQLKESIEELRQKNEEIHAQTEELHNINNKLEKLSIVASKSENSVIIANSKLEIEYVNEGFLRLYEMTASEWLLKPIKKLEILSQTHQFMHFISICKELKKSETYTSGNKTFQNNFKWIQTTITPTYDELGELEYYILIETDVTQIKNAEHQISLQNKKIKYSITYASRIQSALFPPVELMNKTFSENFIFYQPKEIISGDFYWINTFENTTYFAVADCTGHGVPGAFMSILSIALLNDIINTLTERKNAAQILENLREKIISMLHQNISGSESKDGLDISLCVFENSKEYFDFAGAHNSLVIINDEITEIEADKIPVSTSLKMKNFTNKTCKINQGDVYYLFTDGFADQFGQITDRKYYKSRFKYFLKTIHKHPLTIQKDKIFNEFINWKGNIEQVDDVLVVGFKL